MAPSRTSIFTCCLPPLPAVMPAPDSGMTSITLVRTDCRPNWNRFTLAVDGLYLAGVYKRLGELYEEQGNRAKAASYLAKFVELWKDADPELQSRVRDVRARLVRLTDAERR